MIHNLISENQDWIWPLLVGALIVWMIFLWKEWRQFPQPRFFVKGFVALLTVFALVMLVIRPTIKSTSGRMALLTEGFRKQQLDSLRKVHRGLKVLNYHPNRSLPDSLLNLKELYVMGEGVQAFDLWQLQRLPVTFVPGSMPRGIVKLQHPREGIPGDILRVDGIYNRPVKNNRLVLSGPGGVNLDSLVLGKEKEQAFQLSTELKASGNYLFSIAEKDSSGKELSKELLPVSIKPVNKLKIWIMNGFPTFETRYLKNYLAESGHQLMVRSQVSRNRFKTEYLNMEAGASFAFTTKNLDQFDLLIIDAEAYRKLSGPFRTTLEKAIREGGLGVFIQSDQLYLKSTGNLGDFLMSSDNTVSVTLKGWPGVKVEKWPFILKEEFGLQTQQASAEGILTGYKRMGKGRLGLTVLQNTYRLLLDGHQNQFRKIWADILSVISRRADPSAEWDALTKHVYKDEPFHFEVRKELKRPEVIHKDSFVVPLASKIDLPYVWEGITFPREIGWSKMEISGDSTSSYPFYVMDSTQWRSLRTIATMDANALAFSGKSTSRNSQISSRPISIIWFFLLFLSGMSFLWLEPKIYSG